MRERTPWWEVRVSGVLMIGDGLCLLVCGRYWAWDLKFISWSMTRQLERRIANRV